MTDRVKGFVVSLEKDIRIDDVEPIMDAIRMIKGVSRVAPNISSPSDWMNQNRIKSELRDKFYKFIEENFS